LEGLSELQRGQSLSNLTPHSPQNLIPSGFSNWHFGHFIFVPSIKWLSSLKDVEAMWNSEIEIS
jgi:hypothetical protein